MKHIFLMKSSLSIICFLIFALVLYLRGFPVGTSGKEPTCQCRRHKRHRFNPWVGKILWKSAWQPIPVFLTGGSHGQRTLVGYSPGGPKGSDMRQLQSDWSNLAHRLTSRPEHLTTSRLYSCNTACLVSSLVLSFFRLQPSVFLTPSELK